MPSEEQLPQRLEDMYGGILAISRFVADQWQPTGHCKVRLVPNCVDVARFSPEPETPEEQSRLRQMLGYTDEDFVVLYCGRVCEEKGVHRLIEAMVVTFRDGSRFYNPFV